MKGYGTTIMLKFNINNPNEMRMEVINDYSYLSIKQLSEIKGNLHFALDKAIEKTLEKMYNDRLSTKALNDGKNEL